MGTANARVLPDPVRACPITSIPAKSRGMAFSWIGVGSDMFMRERAALMAGFKAIPAKTGAPSARLAEDRGNRIVVNGSPADALVEEEESLRRTLKHGEQYTGRSWLGRKGTVVDVPHSAQTAGCRRVRVDKRGRTDSKGMWTRTP